MTKRPSPATYAHDIIAFLENEYILPETGKPIVLEPWQKDLILRPLFYDLTDEGLRKYTLALLGLPKKHGKSTLAAGIGLWFLYAGEPEGEIIIAANAMDQASFIIYNKIKQAILRNPRLRVSANVLKSHIEMKNTGTTCRPVAHKYATIAGVNPTLVIFDELWGFPSREFYDELTTSPSRKEPLNLIVTYAGYDKTSLLHEIYMAGEANKKAIEEGTEPPDPEMFYLWTHQTLASWITPKYLQRQRKRLPSNSYLRFHENRWAAASDTFITQEDIDGTREVPWTFQFAASDEPYFYVVATDLGLSNDRTARAVVHYDPKDDRLYLDSLRLWQGTPQEHVSIAEVESDLVECAHAFRARLLVVDPWQMESTIQRLQGFYQVEPFNFSADMIRLSQTIITVLRNRKLVTYEDPDLDAELQGIIAKQTSRGWRIDHTGKKKTDMVIALGMAAMHAIRLAKGGGPLPKELEEPGSHQAKPMMHGILKKEF